MTPQGYEQRNLLGFEGDSYAKNDFQALIKKHKIKTIIETGTYLGGTTNQLRQMVDSVITIEVNPEYFEKAKGNIKNHDNVIMINDDSINALETVLPNMKGPLFVFLDAHWGNVCPLLDELQKIADSGLKPIIAIHDFFVPNKTFEYDSYNGKRFDFEFIEEKLANIYGGDYTHFYNTMATGAQRGIIYIEPVK